MTNDPESDSGTIEQVAGAEAAGLRVDRFLAEISGLSRARVKALIEQRRALCDGKVLGQPAAAVRPGALYRLEPPPPAPARPAAQRMDLSILFEDAHLIVLDKPAGLVVHPAPGNPDGTLVNALLAHCGDSLPGIGGEKRPGIVHRLDKDTSGVMVVAKTESALAALSARFAARDIERAYLALCWGLPAPASGQIEAPIGRDPRERTRMAVVGHHGKAALTRFRTERHWDLAASLLECRLATGRTHQIRVHLAHLGHPLVGDPVYLRRLPPAAKRLGEPARQALMDFPRQALHAWLLGFEHPATGQPLRFETAMPADMAALLAVLDANTD